MNTFILLVSFLSFDGSVSVNAYDFQTMAECKESASVMLENGAYDAVCEETL